MNATGYHLKNTGIDFCEECCEHVCEHTHKCLELTPDDVCAICLEPFTKQNVVYLDVCYHKIHRECCQKWDEIKVDDELRTINTEHAAVREQIIDIQNNCHIDKDEKQRRIKYLNNRILEHKLSVSLKGLHTIHCAYCKTVNKSAYSYEDVHRMCCNSVMPVIGSVNAQTYISVYNKYKHRLRPTTEMTKYVYEVTELYKEAWQKQPKTYTDKLFERWLSRRK